MMLAEVKRTQWLADRRYEVLGGASTVGQGDKGSSDLVSAGWCVQTHWECKLRDREHLTSAIVSFFGKDGP